MSPPSWLLPAIVTLPLLAAALAAALSRSRSLQTWLSLASLEIELVLSLWLLNLAASGVRLDTPIADARVVGKEFRLDLAADPLSALFVFLVVAAGLANVSFYATRDNTSRGRTSSEPLLLLTIGAAAGAFTAANLLTKFVFWQVAIVSFALVIVFGRAERALAAASRYFVVNEVAALCLLLANGLLYAKGTPAGLWGWLGEGDSGFRLAMLTLMLLAGAIGSGCLPAHSAFVGMGSTGEHSLGSYTLATSNKIGLYLLVITAMATSGLAWSSESLWLVAVLGAATALVGGVISLAQDSARRVVATASWVPIGCAMVGLGAGGQLGVTGALALVVAHVFGSTSILLSLDLLSGARSGEPGTKATDSATGRSLAAVAYVIGVATLVGVPPFAGFVGQGLSYEGLFAVGSQWSVSLASVGVAGSLLSLAALVRLGLRCGVVEALRVAGRPAVRAQTVALAVVAGLVLTGALMALLPNLWLELLVVPGAGVQVNGGPGDLSVTTPLGQSASLWSVLFTLIVVLASLAFLFNSRSTRARGKMQTSVVEGLPQSAMVGTDTRANVVASSLANLWERIARLIRHESAEPFSLLRTLVMPAARLAAWGLRLTFRLLLR